MAKAKLIGLRRTSKDERGFTLLEYAGGAAVLAGLVFLGFRAFGRNLDSLFQGLSDWTANRTATIDKADGADERGTGSDSGAGTGSGT